MRFPANSSHMCCLELALDRLLFGSKGVLRQGFSPFINPMAVPRWWAPIRAKKLSVAATAPEIFARWHLAIAITSNLKKYMKITRRNCMMSNQLLGLFCFKDKGLMNAEKSN